MTIETRRVTAPGPGAWQLDPVHFPKLMTRLVAEKVAKPFADGFAQSTARYGLMVDRFQPGPVHGVWYHRIVPFGAPDDALGPPPREAFEAITREHPAVRARLDVAAAAFEKKAWRDDLREWDEEAKPRSIAQHVALQAVNPDELDTPALARHLSATMRQLEAMWTQHHVYTIGAIAPVGDYLAHAAKWTGLSYGELLRPLRGSSPVSRGVAADELRKLAVLVRDSGRAASLLGVGDGAAVLARLAAEGGPIGAATRAWIDVAGYRSLGYDITEPYALEMPDVLVDALRATLDALDREDEGRAAAERATAAIRSRVPEEHRSAFDGLLAEAQVTNRLRDERGNYSDAWATGLVRRAVLAAGRRLAALGIIDDPMLAIEATESELVSLLEGRGGPSSDELREHRSWRTGSEATDHPEWFGAPPSQPPPAEWYPEAARRSARAIEAALDALFGEPEPKREGTTLSGLAVSPGTYTGPARLVTDASDFSRLRRGDVLVTRATSATFNVVLPLLGAIVTDRGGQLCHAAIVARESGIPGVVGTRHATSTISDGALVRVDGTSGTVTVLS